MTLAEVATTKPQEKSFLEKLSFKIDFRAYTMIGALIVIWLIFGYLTQGAYLLPRNFSNLSRQMSITSVLAIGMVMVIVATHIDLSVGSILGVSACVAAVLHVWYRWPTPWAILVALTLGALIGLWHGYWVAYQKVPAFIVTLASQMGLRGVLLWLSKGMTVAPLKESFTNISQGYLTLIPGIVLIAIVLVGFIWSRFKSRLSKIKYGFEVRPLWLELLIMAFCSALMIFVVYWFYQYEGIPYPIILVLLLVLIFSFVTNNTKFGRQVYAMGGNTEAARLSGVNIKRRTLVIFLLAGLLASLAGVMFVARLNAATITAGQNYELDAIASCVIGGTSLLGGVGSIPGAILGALVMASLDNGMSMMNMESFWQMIIKGLILLFAVWVDMKTKKKAA